MTRPVHAFVLGAALTLFGQTGIASSLEQSGQPEQSVSVMKTYGVGVATSKGLRTVVPAGWRTYVQPPAALPEAMSWKVGQEWTSVLADLASESNLNVLIDWSSKAVYVRTAEAALDDGAKRAEMLQAATTPLPRFEPASHMAEKPITAGVVDKAASAATASQNPLKTQPLDATALAAVVEPATAGRPSTAGLDVSPAAEPAAGKFAVRKKASAKSLAAPLASVALDQVALGGLTGEAPRAAGSAAAAQASRVPSTTTAVRDVPTPVAASAQVPAVAAAPVNASPLAPLAPVTSGPLSALEDKVVLKATPGLDLPVASFGDTRPQAKPAGSRAEQALMEKQLDTSVQPAAPAVSRPEPAVSAAAAAGAAGAAGGAQPAAPVVPALAPPVEAAIALAPAQAPVNLALVAQMTEALNAAPTSLLAPPGARIGDSADFVYTQPVALNKPSARSVAQSIANRFHLRLVWAAPEMTLRGPVTLLGNSAEEDMSLLKKAMGVYSPVTLDIPTGQGVLMAVAQSGGAYPNLAAKPALSFATGHGARGAVQPVGVGPIGRQAVAAAGTLPLTVGVAAATESTSATAPALELEVNEGEPLEVAIVRFARAKGYTLEWKVDGGFEAKRSLTYKGASVREVLANILPPLGVSADIYKQESHIVVRPADAALDF